MFLMVFFNTIVVSTIASLIDLDTLSILIPFFKDIILNMSPNIRQIIQGVIPTAVLALWTSLMPLMLYCKQFIINFLSSRAISISRIRDFIIN